MNLVIVESPTKARKLSGYLGKDFQVEASVGHVRDLPKKTLGIEIENNFEPTYEVSEDKEEIVNNLKKLAAQAKVVYLAMDRDREGEAIAWHIKYLLTTKSKKKKFLRATFNQITKQAVLESIANPGKINMDLVNAQQARRLVDRLVGYKVSPVLWRKIRRGLSAGRVQSVALLLIVEREREIEAFKPEEYWEVDVGLGSGQWLSGKHSKPVMFKDGKEVEPLPDETLLARVTEVKGKKYEPTKTGDVKPVVADLKQASYLIKDIEKKERRRQSLPPFITSTLQQAAANKFGYSARQTMRLAQQLYEEGLITYHRTDSFNLAKSAVDDARSHIVSQFGKEYLPDKPQFFARKSKNAQEAHEAIRVTDVEVQMEEVKHKGKKLGDRHAKVYDLIWRRYIASQMTAAIYDQTAVLVEATKGKSVYLLRAKGSIKKFAGWTVLFKNSGDHLLPDLEAGQSLQYLEINPQQKFTQPPPRYNDASLIKELEKKGIGRPSTYASIISVIVDRGYVERLEKRFWATKIGLVVSDFLSKHFPNFMNYGFTADMEEDLDRIARGEKGWEDVVKIFYTPLGKRIDKVLEKAKRVQIPFEKTGKKCPECGKKEKGEIVIRTGRFGKFKSCSRFPECKFSENIVEKVPGMKCPLCQEGDIIVKKTRWGKPFYGCGTYPKCDWASWKKPEKDLRVTPKEWAKQKEIRAARRKKREKKAKEK